MAEVIDKAVLRAYVSASDLVASCTSLSWGELKYKIWGNWPRVGFVPLKLKEHEVKLNVVPSGPLTEDTPPSPFEVRPPWLRNRNAYLTWGLIGTARSNLSSAMSPTQSSDV